MHYISTIRTDVHIRTFRLNPDIPYQMQRKLIPQLSRIPLFFVSVLTIDGVSAYYR